LTFDLNNMIKIFMRILKNKKTQANTDGMGNCLQQPGQLLNQLKKSMRETTSQLIKLCVP
jgi:hypothetical protein